MVPNIMSSDSEALIGEEGFRTANRTRKINP